MSNRNDMKKQKLLARKQELLNEIMYYEKRIEEARASQSRYNFYVDDSSESEVEFVINKAPSAAELTLQKERLQTCLRATEELSGVTVLQSKVNVLVDAPTFEGEEPIMEEGLWREVLAECRVDLLNFSITFYTHQPSRQFAPPSYRGLRVTPAEPVHEKELARSILPALTTPSDVVEALRSYAQEHHARRTTLASLAEKYADLLFVEPLPEGGYLLKCADLLRVSWTLQNQRSPLSPFHHYLSFHLEYMDEPYVRRIIQAHKQLGDPALSAHRRTDLLADIIDTCLEARANQQTDDPAKSSEVMGPPKSLPKKTKPKGKENTGANETKSSKDTSETGEGTSKRVQTDDPAESSEVMGPPKSLPKKTKPKGKENTRANERKRNKDTSETGEGTSKRVQTDDPAESSEVMGPPKSLPKKTKPKGKENTRANVRKRNKDTSETGEGTSKSVQTDDPAESSEVMGPPKSLPKKTKPKGKENTGANERMRSKDTSETGEGTSKRVQTDDPAESSEVMNPPKSLPKKTKPKGKENTGANERMRSKDTSETEEGTSKRVQTDDPAKSSEVVGPPKSLPKKTKPKGKENTGANERNRSKDTSETGEGTSKRVQTDDPAKSSEVMGPPKSLPKKTKPKGKENTGANERMRSKDTSETEEGTSKRVQTDDPAKSSEVVGPPKSLPKKTKPKGKENTGANKRNRSKDTSETGEGTSKRVKTDAKNASKKKNNVRSENVYEKFSKQTKNSHSKSSGSEGAESVYFSINRSDNLGKGGKKNKNLPQKLGTRYKNSEALKSTDDVKAKNGQTKSKSVNDKSSEKNVKNDQNKKVSEIELKTKEKIIPAEKETSNLKAALLTRFAIQTYYAYYSNICRNRSKVKPDINLYLHYLCHKIKKIVKLYLF